MFVPRGFLWGFIMKTNLKATDYRVDDVCLAGGIGNHAAEQSAEGQLRRAVLTCLLWEDTAYKTGSEVAHDIKKLIPLVDPQVVYDIAIEARKKQKIRHVPLLIAREMARLNTHKHLVGKLLPKIIKRADELTEFLSLYWMNGRQPLSKQVKKGLNKAFQNFDEYQFAKYDRDMVVKLRDVMFLSHAKPKDGKGNTKDDRRNGIYDNFLYKSIAERTLAVPDTWEVALSSGKDKKEEWTRLIKENRLGGLAFLRNLRNMQEAGVDREVIKYGFNNVNPGWLLPLNYFAAAEAAFEWEREIEDLMFKDLSCRPKLPGTTIFIVDVSGSMDSKISSKSDFTRLDAAAAMALIASEICEHILLYATSGNDYQREHKTVKIPPSRGFAMAREIKLYSNRLGGGGIFTRQCLEYIKNQEKFEPDRIIIFSDSQDCDYPNTDIPKPFGKKNYIVDVSADSRGINYDGVWTAEIAGWSEHFLDYIYAYEGVEVGSGEWECQ
jgi:60 kDa SS-A/Ro ribonucleoprotein